MRALSEAEVQKNIIEYLERIGACVIQDFQPRGKPRRGFSSKKTGSPDLYGAWRGIPFSIEVKKPDEKGQTKAVISEAQKRFRESFSRAGGVAIITDNVDEVKERLDNARKERKWAGTTAE